MLSSPPPKKIAVVNSGHPELDQLAAELAARGRLRQYIGRYFPAGRAWERTVASLPLTASLYRSGPGRRRLPSGLEATTRIQAGVFWDFAQGLPRRLLGQRGERMFHRIVGLRNRAIVRSALRHADPADPVLANYDVAAELFRRGVKHDALRILNYPTAHHAYMRRFLTEEAERHPEFAEDLRGQIPEPATAERLEEECTLASKILVGSSFARDTFVASGVPAEKLFVSPYGVDVSSFAHARDAQAGRRDGTFRAVFVGQISQRKGILYLLEAWRSIHGPGMELVLAGHFMSPPEVFEPYADLYRHAGFLDEASLRALFHDADVLVLPTLIDGLGVVVLQAMAAGLPVIVTANGPGDVVRDGVDGFHVPMRDPGAIAEKLLLLRDNPELRAELGQNASQQALTFTWDRFRRHTADWIESLL